MAGRAVFNFRPFVRFAGWGIVVRCCADGMVAFRMADSVQRLADSGAQSDDDRQQPANEKAMIHSAAHQEKAKKTEYMQLCCILQ